MEGISATAYRGFRSYWRRRGYTRLSAVARRRKARRILELPPIAEGSPRRRRFWKFTFAPRLKTKFRFSPKKLLIRLRDAYVNMMVRLANSPAIGAGYRGDGLAAFGSRQVKEYDEKTIVEIYKSIVAAQGQIVPRDAAWVASAVAVRR